MNFMKVVKQMVCSPILDWELMKAGLGTVYTKMKKEENPNILWRIAKSHLTHNYSNHLKIYTDRTV